MTRDEILNMPAGREIDAMVAEKIMGIFWVNDPDARGAEGFPKYYSTEISAAWEIVKKLNSCWIDHTAPELGIDVEFFTKGDIGAFNKATADTAPLAICRAALLAVLDREK